VEFSFDTAAYRNSVDWEKIFALMRLAYSLAAAFLMVSGGAHAQDPGDDALRLYAVNVVQNPPQSWPGYGVYLGNGLVITAAHVVGSASRTHPSVRIANLELPAKAVKEGSLQQVDLTLLAIDEARLPVSLQLRRMPLCRIPPKPGEPVIVAIPEGIARSTVMAPRLLPDDLRAKFPTVIKDVATTGNSGSGVFDAERKCLLGIMSQKLFSRAANVNSIVVKEKDIAKYFVPAAIIAAFIPNGYAN